MKRRNGRGEKATTLRGPCGRNNYHTQRWEIIGNETCKDSTDCKRTAKRKVHESCSSTVRINSVILWAKGWKHKDICEALLVSESFAWNTVERYRLFGISGLATGHYKGHNFKMTPEQEEATVEFVENNFVPDSKIVVHWVKKEFGIEYTSQGMQEFLTRKGFVYKKPRTVPGKHPSEKAQKAFNVKGGWIRKGHNKNFQDKYITPKDKRQRSI